MSAWWDKRGDDPRAWLVDGPSLIERDAGGQVVAVNLDIKNPNAKAAQDHRTPTEIVEAAHAKESEVLALLDELRELVSQQAFA